MSSSEHPEEPGERELPEPAEEILPVPVQPGPWGARRVIEGCRRRKVTTLIAALLAASVVAFASVFWGYWWPDRQTGPGAQDQVIAVAKQATEALLSYSPESVDQNVSDAKSQLTGEFLQRYTEFADTVVAPAAKQRGIKTEANVARAAVSQMRPDSAQVLVFVNQVTTSKERPTPALATSSVIVSLMHSGGRWLVSDFKPI